jgi:hypothetical protein
MPRESIPADVERYVKEIKESSPDYSEEQVWATAWSIFCKHKKPGDTEHCTMPASSYLKKASTDFRDNSDRVDYYQPHTASTLSADLLARIERRYWGEVGEFKVYGVDGEVLRNTGADIDFTTGGNPARYLYVPPNKLWIEMVLRPSDALGVIIHEGVETIFMVAQGMSYSDAHDQANEHEWLVRQQIESGHLVIRTYDEAIQIADIWIKQVATQVLPITSSL